MLSRYGSETASVFDLLGRNEVDLTAAVGWVLSESPVVLTALTRHIGLDFVADEIAVALEVADEQGRTDIELTGLVSSGSKGERWMTVPTASVVGPGWVDHSVYEIAGLFPLSVERSFNAAVALHAPGVTTVTVGARYYALHS